MSFANKTSWSNDSLPASRSGSNGGDSGGSGGGNGNSSIYDVAKLAGVSPKTVARVYSKEARVKDATRKKVESAASKLGYQPNMAARTMRTGKTKTIGIISPGLLVALNGLKLDAIEYALGKKGYRAIVTFTENKSERTLEALNALDGRQVEGVVLAHDYSFSSLQETHEILSQIKSMDIPCVLSDFPSPLKEYDLPSVRMYASAMADVASLLSEQGMRDVAYWGIDITVREQERRDIFIQAAGDEGLNLRLGNHLSTQWIHTSEISKDDLDGSILPDIKDEGWPWEGYLEHALRASVKELIASEEIPEALVLSNDYLAMAAIQEIAAAGLSVPGDIAIVGYDDTQSARLYNPSITTVRQPRDQHAQAIVNSLLDQLNGSQSVNRHQVISTELIIRQSTASTERPSSIGAPNFITNASEINTFTEELIPA